MKVWGSRAGSVVGFVLALSYCPKLEAAFSLRVLSPSLFESVSEEVPTAEEITRAIDSPVERAIEVSAYEGSTSFRYSEAFIGTEEEVGPPHSLPRIRATFAVVEQRLLCLITETDRYFLGYITRQGTVSLIERAVPLLSTERKTQKQTNAPKGSVVSRVNEAANKPELQFSHAALIPWSGWVVDTYATRCFTYTDAEEQSARQQALAAVHSLQSEMAMVGDPHVRRIAQVAAPHVERIAKVAAAIRASNGFSKPGQLFVVALDMWDGVKTAPEDMRKLIAELKASTDPAQLERILEIIGSVIEGSGTLGRFIMNLIPEGTASTVAKSVNCLSSLILGTSEEKPKEPQSVGETPAGSKAPPS